MKLSTKIAAATRRLRRMEEDRPLFLGGIAGHSEELQKFEIQLFDRGISEMRKEVNDWLTSGKAK